MLIGRIGAGKALRNLPSSSNLALCVPALPSTSAHLAVAASRFRPLTTSPFAASQSSSSSANSASQPQRAANANDKNVNDGDDGPGARQNDSTSALDYKLTHRLRKLPPLPSLEPPTMDAGEAVSNILYNTPAPSKQPFTRHILNCLVQNEPGVLSRVSGTLAARGFNIDSLVVCATEIRDLSRMCIVLRGQDGVVEQARRQLEDLVPVWAVLDYTDTKFIERELMLVKVSILGPEYFEQSQFGGAQGASATVPSTAAAMTGAQGGTGAAAAGGGGGGGGGAAHLPPELVAERETPGEPRRGADASHPQHPSAPAASSSTSTMLTPTEALRAKSDNMRSVIALAEQFRGRVVDVSTTSVIVEMSGKSSRCDAFLKLVRPFGVLECARTGTMVMPRSPIESSWTGADDATPEEIAAVDASLLPPG